MPVAMKHLQSPVISSTSVFGFHFPLASFPLAGEWGVSPLFPGHPHHTGTDFVFLVLSAPASPLTFQQLLLRPLQASLLTASELAGKYAEVHFPLSEPLDFPQNYNQTQTCFPGL